MATTRLLRVEEDGQIILPDDVRQQLGLQPGDLVAVTDTPEGILVTTRERRVLHALDALGAELHDQGVSLEEMIESGREIRGALLRERYGIESEDDA